MLNDYAPQYNIIADQPNVNRNLYTIIIIPRNVKISVTPITQIHQPI